MANKRISDLPQAAAVGQNDYFVVEQSSTAKYVSGRTLIANLATALDGHGGISSIALTSSSGNDKVYTITYADSSTSTYTVTDGNGIVSYSVRYILSASGTTVPTGNWMSSVPAQTDALPFLWTRLVMTDGEGTNTTIYSVGYKGRNGVDGIYIRGITSNKVGKTTTVTISMSDSSSYSYTIDDGDAGAMAVGNVAVNTLSAGSNATVSVSNSGTSSNAVLDFTFGIPVGETGAAATTASTSYRYAYSSSNNAVPSTWYSTIAAAYSAWGQSVQGAYLWTCTELTWNTGTVNTIYTNSYQGVDGTGLSGVVKSIYISDTDTSVSPDEDGVATLSSASLGVVNNPAVKSDGQVLMYDGTNNVWYAGNTSGGTVKSVNSQSPDANGNVVLRGSNIVIDSNASASKVIMSDANGYLTGASVLPTTAGGTGNSSVDSAPTASSTKMVTSGGVYTALAGKAALSHTHALADVGIYVGTVAPSSMVSQLSDGDVYIYIEP